MNNEIKAMIDGHIKDVGWSVIGRTQGQYTCAYTVGLQLKGLPELITYGLSFDAAKDILNNCANKLLSARSEVKDNFLVNDIANFPLALIKVPKDKMEECTPMARNFLGITYFELRQIVFPDTKGKFPWEDGFDTEFNKIQPVLSPNVGYMMEVTKPATEWSYVVFRVVDITEPRVINFVALVGICSNELSAIEMAANVSATADENDIFAVCKLPIDIVLDHNMLMHLNSIFHYHTFMCRKDGVIRGAKGRASPTNPLEYVTYLKESRAVLV
jgi:hypothetical protein